MGIEVPGEFIVPSVQTLLPIAAAIAREQAADAGPLRELRPVDNRDAPAAREADLNLHFAG
eukprot:3565751-Alexandrium_andersonii.AAC.1